MDRKQMVSWMAILLIALPTVTRAGGGHRFTVALDGGGTWGAALHARLAAVEIGFRLIGSLDIRAGYTHYFSPRFWDEDDPRQRLGAGTVGLHFTSPLGRTGLHWSARMDGGIFRQRYGYSWPQGGDLSVNNEFGFGLGLGLQRMFSSLIGLRFSIRGWTFFQKDSFFGEAWPETNLGVLIAF